MTLPPSILTLTPFQVRAAGVEKGSEAKQPELVQSSERHVQKYLGCGQQCVDQITQFYSEDVNFFQFPQ